jgi:hypothetical protein
VREDSVVLGLESWVWPSQTIADTVKSVSILLKTSPGLHCEDGCATGAIFQNAPSADGCLFFVEFLGEGLNDVVEGVWLFEVGQVRGLWNEGEAGVGDMICHEYCV